MKKQAVDGEGSMDRISQLPQPLLHHILSLLTQKEAVQTCVLSKSWLQIGSTRPKIEFCESYFPDDETFLSVLQTTLQRYHDQKFSIQEFRLEMSEVDSESISFLEKWIPIVIINMCVNTFDLSFISTESAYFDMPSAVFQSKALQKLCLFKCKLNLINPLENINLFKHLTTLSLKQVYIADKTLDMILSCCHLIEILVLHSCEGLRTIKLNKSHKNLKLFDFREYQRLQFEDNRSIEINAPTLEEIKITGCPNWLNLHKNLFPQLKSLYLDTVRLSSKSFDIFSCIFPCLEVLSLTNCYGFEELHLSSSSIKDLTIECMDKPAKAVIDAPSLASFEYEGDVSLSIYFKTTAIEWESRISVSSYANFNDFDASSWCLELYEMLKSLSKSKISLDIFQDLVENEEEEEEDPSLVPEDTFGGLCEPVVVELLHLRLYGHSQYSSSVFIINLLHICRPRNIHQFWYFDVEDEYEIGHNQVTRFLENVLLWEREMRQYPWQRDLEQANFEDFYDDEDRNQVNFQLKWRD